MLQYSVSEGVPSVREAMKHFVSRRFHVVRDTDEVLVVSGGQQAIDFAAKCLVNEGDVVAVEDPAFLGAFNTLRKPRREARRHPDGGGRRRPHRIRARAENAVPAPVLLHSRLPDPTGKTMSYEKRLGVYELCAKVRRAHPRGRPLRELRIAGEDLPPIKSFDEKGIVIYAASFSKILSPAMRLACCVCDKGIAQRMVVPSSAATYIPPCGRSACASAS